MCLIHFWQQLWKDGPECLEDQNQCRVGLSPALLEVSTSHPVCLGGFQRIVPVFLPSISVYAPQSLTCEALPLGLYKANAEVTLFHKYCTILPLWGDFGTNQPTSNIFFILCITTIRDSWLFKCLVLKNNNM